MAPRSFDSGSTTARIAHRDSVLEVMGRELGRSLSGLRGDSDAPRLYFMQYTLRRTHELHIRAAHGSLLRARERTAGQLYTECRVGSHRFDNAIDGGLDQRAEERESADWVDAPDDLNLQALQVCLWRLSQLKYEEALEDYYEHKKSLVSEWSREKVDVFSREPPLIHREELRHDPFPRAAWESDLREVSRRFLDHPFVHDPNVELRAERLHRWLANTDGSRVVTQDLYIELEISGWVYTEDGVYTEAARQLYLRDLGEMPDKAALNLLVDEVLDELSALRHAHTPGSLIGPALLSGQAAATLFHEAMGHRLEGERRIARGETRTFAHKIGQRVLPEGLNVFDDPTMKRFGAQSVWGSYRVDDEGVPARKATLVENGVLCGFLQSRTPTPESARSNGHGRHDGLQPPMARMANLVVEPCAGQGASRAALEVQLLELARAQGRRHAIIVERISGGETSTNAYDFQVFKGEPSEVYVIDVQTARKRRIRDVEMIGTPLSVLQRIVSFGTAHERELDNGYCHAESGAVPVSGIAPALLLSELELQQGSTSGCNPPMLPPPFADTSTKD